MHDTPSSQNPETTKKEKLILRPSLWVLVGWIVLAKLFFLTVFLFGRNVFLLENLVEEATFTFWALRGGIYLLFQILDTAIVIWLLLKWFGQKYIITAQRIIIERGTVNASKLVCPFTNLESMKLKRTFTGMLFRYGTIHLNAPIIGKEFEMKNIPQAKKYLNLLENYIESARSDRNFLAVEEN